MTKIEDFKDRMTSPLGMVRIDPKTGKPIRTGYTIDDFVEKKPIKNEEEDG